MGRLSNGTAKLKSPRSLARSQHSYRCEEPRRTGGSAQPRFPRPGLVDQRHRRGTPARLPPTFSAFFSRDRVNPGCLGCAPSPPFLLPPPSLSLLPAFHLILSWFLFSPPCILLAVDGRSRTIGRPCGRTKTGSLLLTGALLHILISAGEIRDTRSV